MKAGPGGLCPPGFGLSFLLVHPLLRRVAGAPAGIWKMELTSKIHLCKQTTIFNNVH